MPKFKKVLLVEDDYITILICEKILKITDFAEEIVSAGNGQEAYNYLEKQKSENKNLPEIILLDLNMPIMTGWDFLDRYDAWSKSVQTIPSVYILSSTVDVNDKERANTYPHVKGFISKPLMREHLDEING